MSFLDAKIAKWKTTLIMTDRNTMICSACASQKDKFVLGFIHGETNFKMLIKL